MSDSEINEMWFGYSFGLDRIKRWCERQHAEEIDRISKINPDDETSSVWVSTGVTAAFDDVMDFISNRLEEKNERNI